MAIPTNAWDETKPAGTRDINLGDDDIREFKTQIRQIVEVDHEIASAGSGADWGKHKILTLLIQAALTTVAGAGRIGVKVISGIAELFYRDDAGTETQITSNGTINVVIPGSTITGEIRGWSGVAAPTNWLLCDGSAINRITYATLFAVTGILYGSGDGLNTFNLPDLRGRVPAGKSVDTEFDTLGKTGGAKTVAHTPSGNISSAAWVAQADGGSGPQLIGTHGHSFTGVAENINVLQPYQVINYIIKT